MSKIQDYLNQISHPFSVYSEDRGICFEIYYPTEEAKWPNERVEVVYKWFSPEGLQDLFEQLLDKNKGKT